MEGGEKNENEDNKKEMGDRNEGDAVRGVYRATRKDAAWPSPIREPFIFA